MLHQVLLQHQNAVIVIDTHGTALSTLLNYYDASFEYERFKVVQHIMPWIVRIEFDGLENISMNEIERI